MQQSVDANPRKSPRQDRSRATVEAILAAAAQVLVDRGYEAATTARIADRAGVSIGSLYQYFPNKEALVAALVERFADGLVAAIGQALEDPRNATLERGMRAVIRAGVGAHRIGPELHKILTEQVPRIGRLAKVMDTHARIVALIEAYFRRHADQLSGNRDSAVAAIVVETVMEALVHKAVIERPAPLAGGSIEEEALSVVMGYLRG